MSVFFKFCQDFPSNKRASVSLSSQENRIDPRKFLEQYRKWVKAGQEDNSATLTRAKAPTSTRQRVCY